MQSDLERSSLLSDVSHLSHMRLDEGVIHGTGGLENLPKKSKPVESRADLGTARCRSLTGGYLTGERVD